MNQVNDLSLNVMKATLGFVGVLFALILLSSTAKAANLTVNISDVEDDNGYVLVALYQGEENYNKGKEILFTRVKAKAGDNQAVFEGVDAGEYAIKIFHDANDNKKLDFNILGIPKEGYAFSNNVGLFGSPAYNEAKFSVKENTAIKINMN